MRDVTTTITDGLLGMSRAKGTGVHFKIGASPIVSDAPVMITGSMDAARIKSRLGLSPLADAAMLSVDFGADQIYCLPVQASTPGTLGTVKKTGTGTGTLTAEGTPNNSFGITVRITGQGAINSALFVYSIDGGYSYSDELTVPAGGVYELAGTGVTIQFADAAENPAQSYAVDDTFIFETIAPSMTNADILAAMDKLKQLTTEYEFVHIVGAAAPATWQAVSVAQKALASTYHKPVFVLMEAQQASSGTEAIDYAAQLIQGCKGVNNYDMQVCPYRGPVVMMDGTTKEINLAGIAAGLYAKTGVQASIGKTRPEAQLGIPRAKLLELLPAGIQEATGLLDEAGFLTFRDYDGLDDYYVYHAKMLAPAGSDYQYAEDVRVKNKIIRLVRKEGLLLLNEDIDLEDVQGELDSMAKFMQSPLLDMVDAGEISSAAVTVPEGQAESIVKQGMMNAQVRYQGRGYIREIMVDIGRTLPEA